jgi:signal transduction histidine kinase
MVALFQRVGPVRVSLVIGLLIATTAAADWRAGIQVSMGPLYVVPVMMAAAIFPPATVVALSALCAVLGVLFYHPSSSLQTGLHFGLAFTANLCAGLFMSLVIQHRRMVVKHMGLMEIEQARRKVTEEQLRILAESSPAAILTLDEKGCVLSANEAVRLLLALPEGETVVGQPVEEYLPAIAEALRTARDQSFQSAAQFKGRKYSGEMFLADAWFSTYFTPEGRRLAAIVVDSSEAMRDQEERHLRQVSITNRVTVAAISHEMRNFCGAISLLYANISHSQEFADSARFQELGHLVEGLNSIASMELASSAVEKLEQVPLNQVLDDLRIVIEPAWKEIGGTLRWEVGKEKIFIIGQRHGVLQVFLNLAQNSHRAVQHGARRELHVQVSKSGERVTVRFRDSGPGVSDPRRLFRPFQSGSASSGMGLYVSRAILHHFGGQLHYEPQALGACFVVDLEGVNDEVPLRYES